MWEKYHKLKRLFAQVVRLLLAAGFNTRTLVEIVIDESNANKKESNDVST